MCPCWRRCRSRFWPFVRAMPRREAIRRPRRWSNAPAPGPSATATRRPRGAEPFVKTVVADFDAPWAMTFLPDGPDAGDREGRADAAGVGRWPQPLDRGDGHRGFGRAGRADGRGARPRLRAEPARLFQLFGGGRGRQGRGAGARPVAARRRGGRALGEIEAIFRARPFVAGDGHYSGRIAFSPDGNICSSPMASARNSPPPRTRAARWARCCA